MKSEAEGYQLNVGGYTGNAGKDSMAYNNGRRFTTYDVDNDHSSSNCAVDLSGGFWYDLCVCVYSFIESCSHIKCNWICKHADI